MKYLSQALREVPKFFHTWAILLAEPNTFVSKPLEQKKKEFTRPIPFLLISLTVLNYLESLYGYFLSTVVTTADPTTFDLKGFITQQPSKWVLVPQLISVGIQATLWYAIFHKWLGHKFVVKTTIPFRRVFNELLYINTPITVITITWFLLGVFIAGQLAFALAASIGILKHLPVLILNLVLFVFVALLLMLLFGGFVFPAAYYNTVVATRVFKIQKRRAMVWCFLISCFAAVPMLSFGLARSQTTPQLLPDAEVRAIRKTRALASAEKHYWDAHNAVLPIPQLQEYVRSLDQKDIWKQTHSHQSLVVNAITTNIDDGYRFTVDPKRRAGSVKAIPQGAGHTVVTEIENGETYVREPSEAMASFGGKHVVPIGLNED